MAQNHRITHDDFVHGNIKTLRKRSDNKMRLDFSNSKLLYSLISISFSQFMKLDRADGPSKQENTHATKIGYWFSF